MQTTEGYKYHRLGIPWDSELLAVVNVHAALHPDWLHCTLHDGSYVHEMLAFLKHAGVTVEDLDVFLQQGWLLPAVHKGSFNKFAMRQSYSSQPSDAPPLDKQAISQMLSMYPLLRHLVETRAEFATATLQPHRDSYLACCRIIDKFLSLKRKKHYVHADVEELSGLISAHMRLHLRVYGSQRIKPKHHWLYDVVEKMAYGLTEHDIVDLHMVQDCD